MIERYSRPELRAIWSDGARYQAWLEVELAVCEAMEAEGQVPEGTAAKVRAAVTIDAGRILEIEQRVQHDVIAFLTHVEEQAGAPARWLHLGLTSSDVLDTAFAVQLQRAGTLLLAGLGRLLAALRARAQEHKELPMVGRTHGMHAEPTTVGLALAGLYAEMQRNMRRLARALEGVGTGKLAGAVGNYGNISPRVEARALEALGLRPEPCATQVVPRDRHAELFSTIALVGTSVERLALQVRHWQRSEVGEASEPFGKGQKGSSAMPHKRNPILCENLCGLARLLRSYAQAALENVPLWHERDISHSSVERVIAPDATILLDFMLARVTRVVDGLVVYPERLEHNLSLSGELVFSESVLLALVRAGVGRQSAYERVQRHALAALAGQGRFSKLLADDPDIVGPLGQDQLAACFDLRHHLRHVDEIFARVFERGASS